MSKSDNRYPPEWNGWFPCDRKHWEIIVAWIAEGAIPPVPREVVTMHLRHLSTANKRIPSRATLRNETRVTDKRVRLALQADHAWNDERANQGPTKGQPRASPSPGKPPISADKGQARAKQGPTKVHTRVGRYRDNDTDTNPPKPPRRRGGRLPDHLSVGGGDPSAAYPAGTTEADIRAWYADSVASGLISSEQMESIVAGFLGGS